ncbi:hypothetical protein FNV43_RR21160 [Rhamnella rubrinervis]|uniref:Uncharacterized protein n=1 Tax=Rhamnella rubrinervis TaxID=2594499 RepID=A0A8K0E081_9ROSA|nr:hypothetical protein FNV43_RR21160 [Rhamnella rubrinervis]
MGVDSRGRVGDNSTGCAWRNTKKVGLREKRFLGKCFWWWGGGIIETDRGQSCDTSLPPCCGRTRTRSSTSPNATSFCRHSHSGTSISPRHRQRGAPQSIATRGIHNAETTLRGVE